MPNWFHCDDGTKGIVAGGVSATTAEAQLQVAPSGQTLYVVPDGTIGSPFSATPDFTALQTYYLDYINNQVEPFITEGTTTIKGQDKRYLMKQTEATVWTTGDDVAFPGKYPFMIAEAAARTAVSGATVTVATVRNQIIDEINATIDLEAGLEGYRVAFRTAVLAATTLPDIVAAGEVDWQSLVDSLTP